MNPRVDPELMEKDPDRIREMFADIAPRYDITNTILTGATDDLWRNRAASDFAGALRNRSRSSSDGTPPVVVDACAGTGKLGKKIRERLPARSRVFASDFCVPLLREGMNENIIGAHIPPFAGDLLRMPLAPNSVDGVAIGFGYRNLVDRERALREIARLLKPEGLLLVLEFHVPENPIFRPLYLFYLKRILPILGRWISGTDKNAYEYLNRSVLDFPTVDELSEEFERCGFERINHSSNMLGISHQYLLRHRTDDS